jgi:hypothetical protein
MIDHGPPERGNLINVRQRSGGHVSAPVHSVIGNRVRIRLRIWRTVFRDPSGAHYIYADLAAERRAIAPSEDTR